MNTQSSKKNFGTALCRALPALLLSSSLACVSAQLESPRTGRGVVLQAADAECKVAGQHGHYSLLFGAAPVIKVPPEKMFPKADASYRVRQEYTYGDVAITILGGLFLSLTKHTITVEECAETPVFATAAQRDAFFRQAANAEQAERDQELKDSLDRFAEKRGKDAEVVVALRDGRQLAGKILSIAEDRLILNVTAAEKTDSETETEPAKTGRTVIPRKDITRIQFSEE